jgi:multidrug efflux pump subunit AcrB
VKNWVSTERLIKRDTSSLLSIGVNRRNLRTNSLPRAPTLAERGAAITRLRDVARIELGAKDYSIESLLDGAPATAIAISQLPGSNAIETADAVRGAMAELSRRFPAGLEYRIVFDTTQFVRESIHAVNAVLIVEFAFGVLPLMFAAGAEMRRALGTTVFYGMVGVTAFGLFLTPVFYVVLRRLAEGRSKE